MKKSALILTLGVAFVAGAASARKASDKPMNEHLVGTVLGYYSVVDFPSYCGFLLRPLQDTKSYHGRKVFKQGSLVGLALRIERCRALLSRTGVSVSPNREEIELNLRGKKITVGKINDEDEWMMIPAEPDSTGSAVSLGRIFDPQGPRVAIFPMERAFQHNFERASPEGLFIEGVRVEIRRAIGRLKMPL